MTCSAAAIRTVNHHFLACWKQIRSGRSKHRGLLSLMRRHRHNLTVQQHERLSAYLREIPALESIYAFKQRLSDTLLEKHQTQKRCRRLAHGFSAT